MQQLNLGHDRRSDAHFAQGCAKIIKQSFAKKKKKKIESFLQGCAKKKESLK